MTPRILARRAASYRAFNRFYTGRIGVLDRRILDTPFSLAEARILYELMQRERCSATALVATLHMDPGYVGRILAGFERDGLLQRQRSRSDARQRELRLTARGWRAFEQLDQRAQARAEATLATLPGRDQAALLDAMRTIERVLGRDGATARITLRHPRSGDYGWIIERHGAIYRDEYGWNEELEALVGEVLVRFVREHDPARERGWIAEAAGERLGSIFLTRRSDDEAQLRLFLVEPHARGRGLGRRLVSACVRFARRAGYRTIVLWTAGELLAARALYQRAGFQRVSAEPAHSFGQDWVSEIWSMPL
jgi:DNA-binding MarR family transcriptional regulator/N-acetylglutamate synthase-like GNAT family acetyltransferase